MSDPGSSDGTVTVTRSHGAVRVVLDRPRKRNAMTDDMWSSLLRALRGIDPSRDRVAVIVGAGDHFCTGSDVGGLLDPSAGDLGPRIDMSNDCVRAVVACPIPVIAAVRGTAAGAGANLALACDVVVADRTAAFTQIFVRRGLAVDTGGSWLLPHLVGPRRAVQVALSGEDVSADTAAAWQMITAVVDDGELPATVEDWVDSIVHLPPEATQASIALLRAAPARTLDTALDAERDAQLAVIRAPTAQRLIAQFLAR